MILNSFLKVNNVWMGIKYRKRLGTNLHASYKARNPDKPLKKVRLKQQGEIIMVYDYPTEFLLTHGKVVLTRFCKRHNIKKSSMQKPVRKFNKPESNISGAKPKRPRLSKSGFVKIE